MVHVVSKLKSLHTLEIQCTFGALKEVGHWGSMFGLYIHFNAYGKMYKRQCSSRLLAWCFFQYYEWRHHVVQT